MQAAPPFQMSPYLQERVCFLGQKEVYQEAATTLEELVHVEVNAKQIERVCHHFGALLEEAEPQGLGRAKLPLWGAERLLEFRYGLIQQSHLLEGDTQVVVSLPVFVTEALLNPLLEL